MAYLKTRARAKARWLVYMLRCADGSLYTGVTTDLKRRLAAHRSGKGSKRVRSRLPVKVAYQEAASSHGAALRREAAIKRLTRAAKVSLITQAKKVSQKKWRTHAAE